MKKLWFSIGFIAAVFLFLIYYIFFVDDPKYLYEAISTVKAVPIILSVLCMVLYWLFETLAQYFVLKSGESKLSFFKVLRVTMVGQLFNCITPSASGGQPAQTYMLVKYGLSVGESACMLLVRFLIYQLVMVVYSVIMLMAKLHYFNSTVTSFSSLALIGFAVNLIVLALLILACFFPEFLLKISKKPLYFLEKIKILKNAEQKYLKIKEEVNKFHQTFKAYKGNLKVSVFPALFSCLQLSVFFMIPYFIIVGLSVDISFVNAFAAAALIFMISSFVPLPGASGGAEGAFLLLFSTAFMNSGKSIAVAILLWRLLTFYLPIICGSFWLLKLKRKNA